MDVENWPNSVRDEDESLNFPRRYPAEIPNAVKQKIKALIFNIPSLLAEFKKMNVNIYNNRVEVSKVLAVNRYVLITVIGFKKVAEILKKITLFNLWF